MDQAMDRPPRRLPKQFAEIWRALRDADRKARSRQALARELGVSTQTLQRILVRGDVPAFGPHASTRVVRAWARTIARLALAFGCEPRVWVENVGIHWDERISRTVTASLKSKEERTRASGRSHSGPGTATPFSLHPPDPVIVALAVTRPDAAGTGERAFFASYACRLLAAVLPAHAVILQPADEAALGEELLNPRQNLHLAAGLAATLPRRMRGLDFVEIPGLTTSLQAFSLEHIEDGGAPASWDEARTGLRRGLWRGLAVEGDPAADHLMGVAAIPETQVIRLKLAEEKEWPRLWKEIMSAPGQKLIAVGLGGVCARLRQSLPGSSSSGSPIGLRVLVDHENSLPAYPLALALCGKWPRWKDILELARDQAFTMESPVEMAALYADLLAATSPGPEGQGDFRVRSLGFEAFPLAGRPFIDALIRALDARLPKNELVRALPPSWRAFLTIGPDGSPAVHQHYCRSCSASLDEVENQGASDRFCRFCSDDTGALRPREEVRQILARWMLHWQGPMPQDEAARRAESLMRAMPAWCEN